MKKLSLIALSLLLIVGMFAGCATSGQSGTSSSTAPASSSTGTASTQSSGQAEEAPAASTLKVALLVPGLLGDKSFFDATASAMTLIEKELGAETKVVEMGTDNSKWYPTLIDYCESDYDLILTVSDAINDNLLEAAEEYPDQMFMNVDATIEAPPANVYVMTAKMGEMSFLAGVAAAKKAEELGETKIGFIGGLDIPGINEFLIGYIDGAQYVNPDMRVAYSYVGSFTDPSKGKETALIMYNDIAVIYAAAGASGLGVFDAAKEFTTKGTPRFAVGVDSDQAATLKDSDPDAANLIITSAIKNIPQYTCDAVVRYSKGEVSFGTDEYMGLKENGVTIAKNEFYEKLLSAESRAFIDGVQQKVVAGEITPINTIQMPTEEVEKIRQAARP